MGRVGELSTEGNILTVDLLMTYNHEGRQEVKTGVCKEEGARATSDQNMASYLWCSKYVSQGPKVHK